MKIMKQVDVIEKICGGGRPRGWLAVLDTRMKSAFLEEVTLKLRSEGEEVPRHESAGKGMLRLHDL